MPHDIGTVRQALTLCRLLHLQSTQAATHTHGWLKERLAVLYCPLFQHKQEIVRLKLKVPTEENGRTMASVFVAGVGFEPTTHGLRVRILIPLKLKENKHLKVPVLRSRNLLGLAFLLVGTIMSSSS